MKKNLKLDAIKEAYWACNQCISEAGGEWPKGHTCTMTHGKCKICGVPGTLIPWVDYNWPEENDGSDYYAKNMRD